MKLLPPNPISEATPFRTAKSAAIATLYSVPVSILGLFLYLIWVIMIHKENPDINFRDILFLPYAMAIIAGITAVLMTIIGIPSYLIAKKLNQFTILNAVGAGAFAAGALSLFFGLQASDMGSNFSAILFLFFLPYGITIAWAFYHLIKQPKPNQ